jgi:hypothetical protein
MKLIFFYLICHFSIIISLPHHKKDTDIDSPILPLAPIVHKHGHSQFKIIDCDGNL